ncbi:MAG: transcription-repair coupling factor [Bacilli bacterium]|nr:transcription-repair coupling factor [Bacilli bacterium]
MNIFDNMFNIRDEYNYSVSGLTKELNALYIYDTFIKKNKGILIIVNSVYEGNDLLNRLSNYTDKVLFFPMDDFITSEAIAISPEFKSERINTINKLIYDDKYIVITNLMGILRYLPSKDLWKKKIITLKKDNDINREKLLNDLYELGYEKETIVTETGKFGIRGYVIDVFPIGMDNPVRIELWGDTIDSIKLFDIDTQLTIKDVDSIEIYPYSEFLIDNDSSEEVIRKQKYLKYYSKNISNISDYMNEFICFWYDYNQIMVSYKLLMETIMNYDNNNKSSIKTDYMFDIRDIRLDNEIYLMELDNILNDVKVSGKEDYVSYNIENFEGNLELFKKELEKYLVKKKTVILCIENKSTAKNIVNYMDIDNLVLTNINEIIDNKINLVNYGIGNGYIFDKYVVISNNDIFKTTKKNNYKSKFKLSSRLSNVSNINKGDYIVHEMHGIGIYDEIVTLTKNGLKKDYIKLIYADGDVLYVPVEKIDRISKFVGKEASNMKLNKLNTDEWTKRKNKVRDKLNDIAGDLIKVSAEREMMKGFAFSEDDENQVLFDSEFEYTETADQLKAINSIKREMELSKPMDMLLCGDVGYGKTEVAFRAMFKAVNDGKQVAYLCPTTILSSQQYKSALNRFKTFPVNIALLNRFVPYEKQKKIIEDVNNGKIDILFGTHKILNDAIKFKNLGLLVIDEEQRFGVTHKEKIKKYKSNIDVLTLSATPIPRTLQMSMSGIRSLSLIETPPEERLPIQTYVLPENDNVVKDAIYKELSRNGQVFVLYNRVETIENKLRDINKLVPEARIRIAHGQMSKTELEDVMIDFINHEFDILLCTTIIETGIDIANVNTLIIFDADRFGLSQLYQIRGRIGRSDKVGYAYLMYDNRKELNDLAVKRLSTIKEFTELGSGFKIAMRDLSIRGAGDILGSEQSGYIDSIGIDLYLKMLKEAVDKLKGTYVETKESDSVKPIIEVDTHISNDYVSEDDLKIEIHKKINEIDGIDKLLSVKEELEDRFGKISKEMELYMYEEWLEKLGNKLEVKTIKQTNTFIELEISKEMSGKIDGEKLFYTAYEVSKNFKLKQVDGKIHIILSLVNLDKHNVFYLIDLFNKIISDNNL